MSRKYEDIIRCLEESALEIQFYKNEKLRRPDGSILDLSMQTQEKWLRDVADCDYEGEGLPDPIDWSNNRDIAFAKLNLAAAGQQLNVRKLEEDGIDDWIGQDFPAFKDNPNYHPYPKNYKMHKTHRKNDGLFMIFGGLGGSMLGLNWGQVGPNWGQVGPS